MNWFKKPQVAIEIDRELMDQVLRLSRECQCECCGKYMFKDIKIDWKFGNKYLQQMIDIMQICKVCEECSIDINKKEREMRAEKYIKSQTKCK